MSANKRKIGGETEKLAVAFLKERGYRVLQTNYRNKFAEVDIIAENNDVLCFIEVKSRTSLRYGTPFEAVTWLKQKKIIAAALSYIHQFGRSGTKIRFDVVGILLLDGEPARCRLLKNAFESAE